MVMGWLQLLVLAAGVQEKYEWWWMYMCDAKRKQLLAGPMQICTLGDHDEVLSPLPLSFTRLLLLLLLLLLLILQLMLCLTV